jgi:outer membrane receptor protein involved in Fe transport
MHLSPDPTIVADKSTDVKAVAYSNLTLTAKLPGPFSGESSLYLNVQNVFDQKAPIAASYANSGQPGLFGGFAPGDDPIGRYYTVGVRMKF